MSSFSISILPTFWTPFLVELQLIWPNKPFEAKRALMRFLYSMKPCMLFQVRGRTKSFGTNFAQIRFLSSMNPCMPYQVRGSTKSLGSKIWITSKTSGGLIFNDFEDFFSCFSVFWWLWGFPFMFVCFLFQVHFQVQGGYQVGVVSQLTTRWMMDITKSWWTKTRLRSWTLRKN